MVATIFPLPSELALQILSLLPLEDLKSLSACSKEVRRPTSVVLFKNVVLCPAAIDAFRWWRVGGGSVSFIYFSS